MADGLLPLAPLLPSLLLLLLRVDAVMVAILTALMPPRPMFMMLPLPPPCWPPHRSVRRRCYTASVVAIIMIVATVIPSAFVVAVAAACTGCIAIGIRR